MTRQRGISIGGYWVTRPGAYYADVPAQSIGRNPASYPRPLPPEPPPPPPPQVFSVAGAAGPYAVGTGTLV